MTKFDAATSLGIIGGLVLLFLWLYGTISLDAPRVIKIASRIISCALIGALGSFVVYCFLVLIGW